MSGLPASFPIDLAVFAIHIGNDHHHLSSHHVTCRMHVPAWDFARPNMGCSRLFARKPLIRVTQTVHNGWLRNQPGTHLRNLLRGLSCSWANFAAKRVLRFRAVANGDGSEE